MKKFIIVLLIIPFLMTGCWNYSELNTIAIVTGFSVDYENDEYKVSMLIANSKKNESSSKEGESQTTVYSGSGKTLSEAITQIDRKSPKSVYIGHLSVVVISEDVAKKGILDMSDLLLRSAESRKKFYFLQARDTSARDILSLVMPLESFPSHGIAALLKTTSEAQAITTTVPYSYFITDVLKPGVSPLLPTVEIIGDADEGRKSSSLETTKIKTYLKVSDLAIFKDDKFISYAENDDSQMINILNSNTNSLLTTIDNDNLSIGFNLTGLKANTKLIDPAHIQIKVTGKADIREINNKINLEESKTVDEIQDMLNKNLKGRLKDTLDTVQHQYKTDVFGYGNMIYKEYPKLWKKLESDWDDKYFPKVDVSIETNIKIVSTGSLKQTIKEVK